MRLVTRQGCVRQGLKGYGRKVVKRCWHPGVSLPSSLALGAQESNGSGYLESWVANSPCRS